MSWENYNPITDSSQFEFEDEINIRVGDGITRHHEDGTRTAYLVVTIDTETQEATLYNYTDEVFETVSRAKILEWRQDDATHSPFTTSHELTVLQTNNSDDIIGVKIHGSGIQFPQTIEQYGRDAFAYCLRIALQKDKSGDEITEPYYPDESVIRPTFAEFVQAVKDEFVPILTEQTALPTEAAEDLLDNILKGYEVVARSRFGIGEEWYYFDSTEEAKAQVESVETSETSLENEFVARSGGYGNGDMVIFH